MEHAMEWFDDDVTVIQVREEFLALAEPPALPFPLIRRKADRKPIGIFAMLAKRLFN